MSNSQCKTSKNLQDKHVDFQPLFETLANVISENSNIDKNELLNDPKQLEDNLKACVLFFFNIKKAIGNKNLKKLKLIEASKIVNNSLLICSKEELEVKVKAEAKAMLPLYNIELAEIKRKQSIVSCSEQYITEKVNDEKRDDVVMVRKFYVDQMVEKIQTLEAENEELKVKVSEK